MLCNLVKIGCNPYNAAYLKPIPGIKQDYNQLKRILLKSVVTLWTEFFWPAVRISYGICKQSNEIWDAY
jgi:hypothetical protein